MYGRRPATIISIIILLGATVGCALSQTWEQHLALRIIQGFASGATESVGAWPTGQGLDMGG